MTAEIKGFALTVESTEKKQHSYITLFRSFRNWIGFTDSPRVQREQECSEENKNDILIHFQSDELRSKFETQSDLSCLGEPVIFPNIEPIRLWRFDIDL